MTTFSRRRQQEAQRASAQEQRMQRMALAPLGYLGPEQRRGDEEHDMKFDGRPKVFIDGTDWLLFRLMEHHVPGEGELDIKAAADK